MNNAMDGLFSEYADMIESALAELFAETGDGADGLREAMRYSIRSGGKRLRPTLCLEFCRVCGGDVKACLPVACAVELLHTYSLIHDDLPCMDDDDQRRGKPSCHKQFGEMAAVLAGDCLQAEAFASICRADIGEAERFRCCDILSRAAGIDGICGGQYMDLTGGAEAEASLRITDEKKTAALMSAACAMGAAAAGADRDIIARAEHFGQMLGMAFQCRDDILDGDGFCALLGKEECQALTARYTSEALTALSRFHNTGYLEKLTQKLCTREI